MVNLRSAKCKAWKGTGIARSAVDAATPSYAYRILTRRSGGLRAGCAPDPFLSRLHFLMTTWQSERDHIGGEK